MRYLCRTVALPLPSCSTLSPGNSSQFRSMLATSSSRRSNGSWIGTSSLRLPSSSLRQRALNGN